MTKMATWRKRLPNVCPEALTYIEETDELVEVYRSQLRDRDAKIATLQMALLDAHALQSATESWVFENAMAQPKAFPF